MAESLTNALPSEAACNNAWINLASATADQSVVAAVAGKKIRVHAAFANEMSTGAAASLFFESSTTTAISPTWDIIADGGGFVLPFSPVGWFETVAGEALTATTGTASACGLIVVYSLVSSSR